MTEVRRRAKGARRYRAARRGRGRESWRALHREWRGVITSAITTATHVGRIDDVVPPCPQPVLLHSCEPSIIIRRCHPLRDVLCLSSLPPAHLRPTTWTIVQDSGRCNQGDRLRGMTAPDAITRRTTLCNSVHLSCRGKGIRGIIIRLPPSKSANWFLEIVTRRARWLFNHATRRNLTSFVQTFAYALRQY